MRIRIFWLLVGVPDGTPIIAPLAKAVTSYVSHVSAGGVSVVAVAMEITRGVKRLLVRVCVAASVTTVPLVGNVMVVEPVTVNAMGNAPTVDKFPANVRVLDPLLTPVPPLAGFKMPARTTAPVDGDDVRPVDPVLNDVTPPPTEDQAVPV
jgi:hypothetical protein